MVFSSDELVNTLEKMRNEAEMANGSDDTAITGS